MKNTAIIDLGSNSIRMSTYAIDTHNKATETGNFRSMIKLSEGMTADGMLSPDAQLRAIRALLEYKSILAANNISSVKAVATAAVRKAKNGKDFVNSVKETTGIAIEVIDGQKEAYYDFLAVTNAHNCRNGIICDIGGGSTELIGIKDGTLLDAESLPVASRNITENFFANGETPENYSVAKEYIHSFMQKLKWLSELNDAPIFGIGGCLRAVAKYDLRDSSKAKINGHRIPADRMKKLFCEITTATYEEKSAMPGIGEERADIISGGVLVAECLTELIAPPEMIVSDVGVRDGILAEMINTI